MKIAMIIVRTLMGLLFIFAAVVVLFNLVPKPELTGAVKTFNEGMDAAPYFITVIKLTELICGIAFVVGRYVPLATVVIAPVIVQIFLFHLFLDRSGLPVAIFLVAANIFVAWYYRDSYRELLKAK
jgi:putative oxidoreductase